jgi:arylsulfatase A-like enzyme
MPNVLVLMLDDARRDIVDTMPNVRALARQGTTFTRAYSETPVCAPARANFLRGQSSARTGLRLWTGQDLDAAITAELWDHDETFASWIANESIVVGKYLNIEDAITPKPAGWDEFHQAGPLHEHVIMEDNDGGGFDAVSPGAWHIPWSTDLIADHIAEAAGDWLVYWASTSPHVPQGTDREAPHSWAPYQETRYDQDGTGWPSWIEALNPLGEPQWRDARSIHRSMVREAFELDRAFGLLMADVDLEDTLVFVTSDNGAHMGDHRIYGSSSKNTMYESAFGIPLVAAGPGLPLGQCDVPVGLLDIVRTITDATGSTAPHVLDGEDLRDVATDPGAYAGRALLGRRLPIVDDYPEADWVVTATRKLARHDAAGDDEYEMYDLDSDPGELVNVANDAGRLTERNALEATLDDLLDP